MKLKDFQKYRKPRPEGHRTDEAPAAGLSLFGMNYGLSKLSFTPLREEDRLTMEEAQRLRDAFARDFPALEETLEKIRNQAYEEMRIGKRKI